MIKLKRQAIVLVSAYDGGYGLAPCFLGRGYQCFHVNNDLNFSQEQPTDAFFSKVFHTGNAGNESIDDIISELKNYDVRLVIAADEGGVLIADKIADSFNVLKNSLASSLTRRHKYHMIEALRHKNVPCAAQFCSDNVEEIITWFQGSGFSKVVLKPPLSAHSDGVGVCENEEDIKRIFNDNINQKCRLGDVNNEYVVQEYLEGKIYVVNTMSIHGVHFVTDAWDAHCHNEGIFLIEDYMQSLSRENPLYHILQDYTFKVLDALGIQNGPAISEVKMTPEGPKLVEAGARLPGYLDYSVLEECHGFSQLSLMVDSYLEPHLFTERIQIYKKQPQIPMRLIFMFSPYDGIIKKPVQLDRFLEIPSVMSMTSHLKLGDELKNTKYCIEQPGSAMLANKDPKQLEEDYLLFRKLEKVFYTDLLSQRNQ